MQENNLSSKLFNNAKQLIPGGVNSPVRAFRNVGGEPFFVRAGVQLYLVMLRYQLLKLFTRQQKEVLVLVYQTP